MTAGPTPRRVLYDITPAISPALAVWPGDTPPSREVVLDLAQGDTVTLATLRSTVHAGAHADAPSHVRRGAPAIDQQRLESYLGACQVVRVEVPRGGRVQPEVLTQPIQAERVLFATGTFPDPNRFNQDFAALSPELIEVLAARGVKLVGIDTPSVDLFASKDLPAHHACVRHQIAILEGLVLEGVPEGTYELIALPLKLAGFDASPVRAVLRS